MGWIRQSAFMKERPGVTLYREVEKLHKMERNFSESFGDGRPGMFEICIL